MSHSQRLTLAVGPQRQTVLPSEAALSTARTRKTRAARSAVLEGARKLLTTASVAPVGSAVTRRRTRRPTAFRCGRASRAQRAGSHCTRSPEPPSQATATAPESCSRWISSGAARRCGVPPFGFTDHHQHADRVAPIRRLRARRCRLASIATRRAARRVCVGNRPSRPKSPLHGGSSSSIKETARH